MESEFPNHGGPRYSSEIPSPLLSPTGLVPLQRIAKELGKHPRTLKRWADKGKFPQIVACVAGRFVRKADLTAWAAKLKRAAGQRIALPGMEAT